MCGVWLEISPGVSRLRFQDPLQFMINRSQLKFKSGKVNHAHIQKYKNTKIHTYIHTYINTLYILQTLNYINYTTYITKITSIEIHYIHYRHYMH